MAFSDIISRIEFDCNPELKRQYTSYVDYLSAAVKELPKTSLYDYAKKYPEIRKYVSLPNMAAIDKRFVQKKKEFGIVWTEYQQSKKETSTLKYELSKTKEKYGDSDKPSDEAEITKALAAYQESEGTTSLLLSKAFGMTHGVA